MYLTVFGGTGGTGSQVIRAALAAGHVVTAPARDPARIEAAHERLRTVRADVLEPETLRGTMDGVDAVISAIGPSNGRKPTAVYSGGVTNILDEMRRSAARRLIAVSASPVTPRQQVGFVERFIAYPVLYRIFGEAYADQIRMEDILRRSDVDWTVLRPPRLTNGPATGRYRTAADHLRGARTISRADLADAVLRQLDDRRSVRTAVGVGY